MKILHITYHTGCAANLNFVAKELGYNITTQYPNWNYNIGHARAEEIWNKYKDYYNTFDLIITSDTGPLSRIFLQNNYTGKLIIWVCNRFDYADQASNDCKFPDKEYYDLFRSGINKPNVKVYSYTKFEHEYAKKFRNIDWGTNTIKPCAFVEETEFTSAFPKELNKSETFFLPSYHNDTILLNLKDKCNELNIPAYQGRYHGPTDLKGFRGIIHIPYAWSNLALFENWLLGNVYFIPTKEFLLKLAGQGNFFWSPPFPHANITSAEWYLPEYKDLFMYFDTWSHLREIIGYKHLINEKQVNIVKYSKEHTSKSLNDWKLAIEEWG